MKKPFIKTALLSTAVLASVAVLAEDKVPGSGPNPFSDCGIGAALFPSTKWAAVTSNVIWDIGTTAVTSATASPETCNGKTVETAMFINRTYDELVEETARGEGEHVTAMLDMMGCALPQHLDAAREIRGLMGKTVSSETYSGKSHIEKAAAYYDAMSTAVENNCGAMDA